MPTDYRKFKILLVDDRIENILALQSILDEDNYKLIPATSGKEALTVLLNDVDFHLIILDVVMPFMNGFEAAEMIYAREKLQNIPIIFLTAMDIEGNVYKGYQAGAIDYISKPIIPELLKVKVKAFVELSEKNRELVRKEQQLRLMNNKLQLEIAERKASEEKIKALNSDLEERLEQVQSLDAFNYSVSHDLMSPINNIGALTDILQRMLMGTVTDEVMQILGHLAKSTEGMSRLIKDMLKFSRDAHAEMAKDDHDMHALVQEVLDDISLTTSLQGTEIVVHNLPNDYFDRTMMKQVWTNLISNAVKYSQKKQHPRVEIGIQDGGANPVYFVRDNGVGFDMKHYDKLFEAFKRLHTDKEFNGSGIGLATVKRIIERHDGKIWAESAVNNGSHFFFTLNAVQQQKVNLSA